MRRGAAIAASSIAALLATGEGGLAQDADPAARATAHAVRLAIAPTLDGDVLDDPAWQGVPPASGFIQNTPDEGQPATERTEVYIAHDDRTLFIGVVCYDRNPEGIIVAHARRDESLDETDSFQIILDTYRDRQGGFVFGTNPAGAQFDGQVTGQNSGDVTAGNTFNRNWDAAWEVEARITEIGWSAELAIPFRSLRYPGGDATTWGVNFQRNIRRRNETSFWAPLTRQFNLYWVSRAGDLEGVEAPHQRNLQLTPYALADSRRSAVTGAPTRSTTDFGADLKLGLTPSLTLDATVNTDFAQVEADEQQINLDRFNLFFPEKRPFFLENAGLFDVGVPEEVALFFSRRIGLGPNGEEIPIAGGLRVSGKAGRHNIGLLAMRTEAVAGVAAETDFSVARYSRDLPNRSAIGAIFVNRDGKGDLPGGESDTNRVFGVDGRWGIGEYGELTGFVARTDTPGIEGGDHAFQLLGRYSAESWSGSLGYTEIGDGFNPEAGFLSRRGYRRPEAYVLYRARPKDLWGLHEIRPHVAYRGYWDFDGFQETGYLHLDSHWEWQNGYEVHTGVNLTREGVKEPFEIADGVIVPPGTYEHEEIALVFFTNLGAPVSFTSRAVIGGFFGGDRVALSGGVDFRLGEKLNSGIEWVNNDIDLPGGSFETNLGRLRTTYSFTPKILVQALVQYNDRADVWATNLRFTWLGRANSGLFVVYNEIQDVGSSPTGIAGRELIVKYSRLIDLLR